MALNPFFVSDIDPFSPRIYTKDVEPMTSLAQALMAGSAASAMKGFQVEEDDNKYSIIVDVPGFKPADIKVELEGGCDCKDCGCKDCNCSGCQCQSSKVLHIHGERSSGQGGTTSSVRIDRRFTFGCNVDVDRLTANIEHGVLIMEAPKLQPPAANKKTIEVNQGSTKEIATSTS